MRIPPSPGSEAGDADTMLGVKNISLRRRHSTALGLVDGSDHAYQKASVGTRRVRRVVLKSLAFLLLGVLLTKGIIKSYPSVDLFSAFDLEVIPGLDVLSDTAKPWASFLPKKKPAAWEAEREKKEKAKEREREEREREQEEQEREQEEQEQEREHARSSAVTFRERELWAAPTTERLSTMVVGEKKGNVHEETVIFLHVRPSFCRPDHASRFAHLFRFAGAWSILAGLAGGWPIWEAIPDRSMGYAPSVRFLPSEPSSFHPN